ncbi:MAG TPA: TraB/GumN family protein, partial [Puia sp.]|nr:TraB/GumN family protein [Puia sp.]
MEKPSYLYGTIHLNDKRLFVFDDSVYRAIEKTEGLAIEVNPDELAAWFVNKMFDQFSNGKKLKDVIDEHYFS